MEVGLTIPFPFPDPKGNDYDWRGLEDRAYMRYQFWDSQHTIDWFEARGYTLYERHFDDLRYIAPRRNDDEPEVEAEFPFPHHDNATSSEGEPERTAIETTGTLAFAQNKQGQHVVIKLVPNDTDELRIYKFIAAQDMDTLRDNCILPVLEILSIEDHSFVVSPR
ncbi:hypothetical protein CC2G_014746 [Coprinopsis cinerea AmutBmut pab1-1]|nr:hypothetical protein CC2G_014746 [Coprinopsis cinerea AmutBmut pab1-1]